MFANPTMSIGELISWTLDNRPLAATPGSAYAYSNFGYAVLGRVIERITGKAVHECGEGRSCWILRGSPTWPSPETTVADRQTDEVFVLRTERPEPVRK